MDAVLHVVDSGEQVMDGLGLMRGPFAPLGRFALGFLGGSLITSAFSPGFAYNADGSARPFYLTSPDSSNATYFPWWFPGLISGAALGTLI